MILTIMLWVGCEKILSPLNALPGMMHLEEWPHTGARADRQVQGDAWVLINWEECSLCARFMGRLMTFFTVRQPLIDWLT